MIGQRCTRHTAFAVHDIHHAVWNASLFQQGDQPNGRQRRLLRGLDHDAVTGGQRRSQAFGQDHQRMVERGHQRDDAKGHALRVAKIVTFNRNDVGATRQRECGEVAVELRQPRNLRSRLADRPSVAERLQTKERFDVGFEEVGELVHHLSAVMNRLVSPHTFIKGPLRGQYGAVDIDFTGSRKYAD